MPDAMTQVKLASAGGMKKQQLGLLITILKSFWLADNDFLQYLLV